LVESSLSSTLRSKITNRQDTETHYISEQAKTIGACIHICTHEQGCTLRNGTTSTSPLREDLKARKTAPGLPPVMIGCAPTENRGIDFKEHMIR